MQRTQAHGGSGSHHPSMVLSDGTGCCQETQPQPCHWLPGVVCASPSGDAQPWPPRGVWLWLHHSMVLRSLWHKLLGSGETSPLSGGALGYNPAMPPILGGSVLSPSVGAGDPHTVEAPVRAASTHLGCK